MVARRGFILFFGTRNRISAGENGPSDARCPRCNTQGTLVEKTIRPWFTLFFLPIFPIGRARPLTVCTHCQASFAAPVGAVLTHVARNDARENLRAIAMYNSLRASPGNSITLNDLMQLYASMDDVDAGISAAADFPAALNNSEQCMTTLARLYLAKNEHAAALQWLNAALQRNPQLADAHYYKAAALLTQTPPDGSGAAAAARSAKNAGHPDADALLQQANDRLAG